MSEQIFGEATVVMRARLDELQRDLDQSERLVQGSVARVQQAQQQTVAQMQSAGGGEGGILGSLIGGAGAIASLVRWGQVGTAAVAGLAAAIASLPVVATAASVALVGLATGGVALLVAGAGAAVGAVSRLTDQIGEIRQAWGAMDGSTDRARVLAEELRQLPVVGRLASFAFKLMSDDTLLAEEALTSLVATVQSDGQVIVAWWARLPGYLTGATQAIDKANSSIRENNRLQAFASDIMGTGSGARDLADTIARQAAQQQLQGIERVAAAERERYRQAMSQFRDMQRAVQERYTEERRALSEMRQAGELSTAQFLVQQAMLASHMRRQLDEVQAAARAAGRAMQQAAATQLIRAQGEANTQAAADAVAGRSQQAARDNALAALTGGATITDLRSAGRDLEADLLQIEQSRQAALRDARVTFDQEQMAAVNRFYDAQVAAVKAGEARAAQERERQQADVESQLREQVLRNAGRNAEAQAEAIRRTFRDQIRAAEEAGNEQLAKTFRALQDAQLAGLGQSPDNLRLSTSSAFDRIRGGGSSGPAEQQEVRVAKQDQVIRELQGIRQAIGGGGSGGQFR